MKYYVSVDMEGIAGVVFREQLFRGESMYEEARRLLTREVNVIVESLLRLGATQILVKDAHGSGYNFIAEQLHPGAEYIIGATKPHERFPGLDSTFNGALLIGYHAMGGTMRAVRDHTMTSAGWQTIALNGVEIGEIALDALIFGLCNVPVLFVSGDDQTCMETMRTLGHVTTYETKKANGRHAAIIKPPQRVYEELPNALAAALNNSGKCVPYRIPGPYELTIRFMSTDQADARYFDGVDSVRLDGVTAVYRDNDLLRLFSRTM